MPNKKLMMIGMVCLTVPLVIGLYYINIQNADDLTIEKEVYIENCSSDIDNINLTASIQNDSLSNETLYLPAREAILDGINWSNYPLISNPYIHCHEISEPTETINHTFLYVTIVVDVNNDSDRAEVLRQLSGIVLEERKILGPNSSPNVWGRANGVWVYYAAMCPYDTKPHARYYP